MKMRIFFLTVFSLICFSGISQTDKFQEEIVSYLNSNGTSDQYSIAYEEMFQVIRQQFQTANVPESYWSVLKEDKKDDLEEIIRNLTFAYRTHFTAEDISKMAAFYQSDAGKQLIDDTVKPNQESIDAVNAFYASELGLKIKSKSDVLSADISQISEYWSRDLFAKKMGQLIKAGYVPQQ